MLGLLFNTKSVSLNRLTNCDFKLKNKSDFIPFQEIMITTLGVFLSYVLSKESMKNNSINKKPLTSVFEINKINGNF